ncbi:MAG: hypothetical protein PHT07_10805 [Paludibacter sp.]|nr:hypothetical protein [Paludibacter sp.]
MEFSSFYNYEELQAILGAKIKEMRLSIGRYNQREQAAAAGVPYSTYRLIEQQGRGSIEDFMKILLSMGKVDNLNMLFEKRDDSVMDNFKEVYDKHSPRRMRTSRQRIRS